MTVPWRIVAIVACVWAMPAHAHSYGDLRKWCFGEATDEQTLQGCDAIIAADRESKTDIAIAYMNRGLGIPGRIKVEADGSITAPSTDEAFMREHFKEWKRLMKATPNMRVKRDV